MSMTDDGFVTCPSCSSRVRVGRFYKSESPNLEPWIEQLKSYYAVDIYRVQCQECSARFNASTLYGATLFYLTPDK